MPSITSIEERYDSATGKIATTLGASLNANVRAKVSLADTVVPSAARIDINGKQWSVAHSTRSQDFTFRWNWTTTELPLGVGKCKLNVTQNVPKGNWALVPNPVVKLTKTGGFMGKNNVASLERDMMARKSAAAVTLYAGDDDDEKRYKVKLSGKDVDVLGSLEGVARAKLWKRSLLHSVKLTGSQTRQAVGVKSRVRLFEGDESKQTQKLKSLVTVERKGGDVALGWSLSHAMHVADVKYADKIKTTVDFKVPLSGGGGGLGGASVVAGVKLDVA